MSPEQVRKSRRGMNFSRELLELGWYHSFELPDGSTIKGYMGIEHQRERWARFPIPEDLSGKRVLDIGAWDGWFSFEAESHGAAVTAIDCVEVPNFLSLHKRLRSGVDYRILDFYELPEAGLAPFDIVFFLGVLYHLKHPLLALEIVCALTTDVAVVDSFVIDGDTWRDHAGDIPAMEFYETDELGDQLDNWIGPSVACLMALCRAAGFARVELLAAGGNNAALACHRRWEPVAADAAPAPELVNVSHTRNAGINFYTRKDEYISCWFGTDRTGFSRQDVRLDVDGFGVPALWIQAEPGGRWMANFRLPPGLHPGWREVRLGLAGTRFSEPQRIAVDMQARAESLSVGSLCGGISWTRGVVTAADRPYLSCWVRGLGENCDCNNIRAWADSIPLKIDFRSEPDQKGFRQINLLLPRDLLAGEYRLRIEYGGVAAPPVTFQVND